MITAYSSSDNRLQQWKIGEQRAIVRKTFDLNCGRLRSERTFFAVLDNNYKLLSVFCINYKLLFVFLRALFVLLFWL